MTTTERLNERAGDEEWLDERGAAAFLRLSPHTLTRWRWSGKGPKYSKFGRAVRYGKRRHLLPFVEASTRSSTSDTGSAPDKAVAA